MKIIRPMSPLRQRMLEDMQIRNYATMLRTRWKPISAV